MSEQTVEQKVIEIVRDNIVDREDYPIMLDANLEKLGLDAIDLAEVRLDIEDKFKIDDISDEIVEAWETVGDIVKCVEAMEK